MNPIYIYIEPPSLEELVNNNNNNNNNNKYKYYYCLLGTEIEEKRE